MNRIYFSLLFLLATFGSFAGEGDWQNAKVLAVKSYDRGRIAYWEGRAPIYDGYPFYDITLSLGQKKYVVRYDTMTGYFPSAWRAGKGVEVRFHSKGRMLLRNGTEEVEVNVFNERAADCVPATSRSAVLYNAAGSQVPCE